ncbi:hypothetical protein CDD83_9542 [Cordyceps sp. RAO-2017]|nr:hypothetical protein CDD83_9542 [Cordyceps sp. RAO-2017]
MERIEVSLVDARAVLTNLSKGDCRASDPLSDDAGSSVAVPVLDGGLQLCRSTKPPSSHLQLDATCRDTAGGGVRQRDSSDPCGRNSGRPPPPQRAVSPREKAAGSGYRRGTYSGGTDSCAGALVVEHAGEPSEPAGAFAVYGELRRRLMPSSAAALPAGSAEPAVASRVSGKRSVCVG